MHSIISSMQNAKASASYMLSVCITLANIISIHYFILVFTSFLKTTKTSNMDTFSTKIMYMLKNYFSYPCFIISEEYTPSS